MGWSGMTNHFVLKPQQTSPKPPQVWKAMVHHFSCSPTTSPHQTPTIIQSERQTPMVSSNNEYNHFRSFQTLQSQNQNYSPTINKQQNSGVKTKSDSRMKIDFVLCD